MNAEGNVVCLGETVQVFINDDGELSLPNPEFYEAWKQRMNLV